MGLLLGRVTASRSSGIGGMVSAEVLGRVRVKEDPNFLFHKENSFPFCMEMDTYTQVGGRGRVCQGQGVRKASLCPAYYIHKVAPTQDEVSVSLMISLCESRRL